MANIAKGIDKIGEIAETLNDIITNTGKKIDINNKTIWEGFLHRWDNTDWEDMLAAFNAVSESAPGKIKSYHENNYARAQATIKRDKMLSDRAMDKKGNKKIAWAMINTFREVWNAIHDKDIPNEDRKAKRKMPKVEIEQTEEYTRTTVWHNLFEVIE